MLPAGGSSHSLAAAVATRRRKPFHTQKVLPGAIIRDCAWREDVRSLRLLDPETRWKYEINERFKAPDLRSEASLANQRAKGGSAHPARAPTPWGRDPAPAAIIVGAVVKARAAPAPPTAVPAVVPAMPPGGGGRRSERRRAESNRGDGSKRKLTEHLDVSSLPMRCAFRHRPSFLVVLADQVVQLGTTISSLA